MIRRPAGVALLLSLLILGAACDNSPAVPTQSPAVVGTTNGGSTPPADPAVPSVDPYNPLVVSPFIVDTGATPGGRLAFSYSIDFWENPIRIYSVLPDGSGFTLVTPPEVMYAWSPSWSPDDALIAYATYGTGGRSFIWVTRPDGTGGRQVIEGDYPFWLADGRIGYQCASTGICAVDPSGANPTVLFSRAGDAPDSQFRLSPDGTMIAFVRFVENATHVYGPGDMHYTVWVMRRDGTGQRRLTSTDPSATLEFAPSWSRDGRQIAFRSGQLGIAVADADGGRLHTVSRQGDISPSIGRGSPAWSPDGTKIIFGGESGVFFIANADGSGLIRRVKVPTPGGYTAAELTWSNR